jgi:tRNA (guanosine-2'-O-)-methyltransferase
LASSSEELWENFEYGKFSKEFQFGAPLKSSIVSEETQRISELVKESAESQNARDTYDPEWSFLNDEQVSAGVDILSGYVREERLAKMNRVMGQRTDKYRIVFENPINPNNCWAALRTFDTFGVQYCDLITDTKNYHNQKRRRSMFEALGAQKWMSLKSHTETRSCLQDLKDRGYRIAVTDIHHPDAKPVDEIDWKAQKTAIVLGNEKEGVTDAAREMADIHFYLPMRGFAESLNVSAFCACLMSMLEMQGCLAPSLDESQRQRILLTWLARTVPRAPGIMRHNGFDIPTDRLYETIAGHTTRPT